MVIPRVADDLAALVVAGSELPEADVAVVLAAVTVTTAMEVKTGLFTSMSISISLPVSNIKEDVRGRSDHAAGSGGSAITSSCRRKGSRYSSCCRGLYDLSRTGNGDTSRLYTSHLSRNVDSRVVRRGGSRGGDRSFSKPDGGGTILRVGEDGVDLFEEEITNLNNFR